MLSLSNFVQLCLVLFNVLSICPILSDFFKILSNSLSFCYILSKFVWFYSDFICRFSAPIIGHDNPRRCTRGRTWQDVNWRHHLVSRLRVLMLILAKHRSLHTHLIVFPISHCSVLIKAESTRGATPTQSHYARTMMESRVKLRESARINRSNKFCTLEKIHANDEN